MIKNFKKVADGLFRGGAPTIEDVIHLHKKFGIKKIISLDFSAGKHIDRACKLLGIKHIIIPIDVYNKSSLLHLLHYDISKLLLKDGPTFIHCMEGKDRTGIAIALFRIKHQGWTCEKALAEAKKFGFGIGVDPNVIKLYKKMMQKFCKYDHNHIFDKLDSNDAYDVVSNERDGPGIYSLDGAEQQSWSPYEDYRIRQFPFTDTGVDWPEQYQTREDYGLDDSIYMDKDESNSMPQSGTYDTSTNGINGAGPSLVGSGYV